MSKFTIASVIALILFATQTVLAQPGDASQDTNPQQPIFRRLGLSEEQLRKIREINQRQRPKIQQANTAVERARQALDDAIYSDEISEEKVRDALNRFNRAQVELANLRMQTEFEIRKVLSPEQLKQFRQMRENRPRKGARMPGRPPRRMGPRE